MELNLEQFKDKKIALLGFGEEGRVSYDFFVKAGANVYVYDEYTSEAHPANTTVDEAELWELDDFDLIIRTPGMPLHRVRTVNEISSATQVFFDLCPAQIIGVTGTKGKGTTSTLIAEILNRSGKKVHLLGNIGLPALSKLEEINKNDIVVFELSSFQLWNINKSPHISVVLMIEPEHLDVHEDLDDYLDAKSNISAHQGKEDITIFHPFNEMSERVAMNGAGIKKKYMNSDTARIDFGKLMYGTQYIMDTENFGLIGPHNRENICAAVTASWEITQDISAIEKAVANFKGLEHRLEFVKEVNGVSFYNDSFATVPAASIAALKSFEETEILILGGSDKGSNYDDLAEAISMSSNIKKVLLIGKMAERIKASLDKFDFKSYEKVDGDINTIVNKASEISEDGDIVLLSPACASFDMFESYKQRGKLFKQAVERL